jgi:multicomponent Na+:H+ antiporter subunit G
MQLALDIASWALIIGGVVFCLIGGYGLLKLKDMYARLHAASLIDTLGVGLVFIGLMLQSGWTLATAKLFLILIFVFFTTPTATHALAKSAINHDVMPEVDTDEELDQVRAAKTPESGVRR